MNFAGYQLTYSIHYCPRLSCNSLCGQISTEMKIYYNENQWSPAHYVIPARFELFDDYHLRCVWNTRFLFPVNEGSVLNMLEKFARYALATDLLLIDIGVKEISQTTKVLSLLSTDVECLVKEFYSKGISILDDGILALPKRAYENSPILKLDRNIISQFRWTNFITRIHHSQTYQLSNFSSDSSGTSYDFTDSPKHITYFKWFYSNLILCRVLD